MGGHPLYRFLDLFLKLPALHRLVRQSLSALHEIDEFPTLLIPPIDRRLQGTRRPARLRADQIARFIRCDREKPWPESPLRIKLSRALVNLQEGFLKYILCAGPIPQEAHEEMEQLALISLDEFRERCTVSLAIFR